MTDAVRALTLGLLASTALATPALAQNAQPQTTGQSPAPGTNATDVTAPPPRCSRRRTGNVPDQTEIIITATKREENLQNVPISVQAIGTRRLDQLNISNFEDYTKQLPSVSFLTAQPGSTTVYMRGVSAAGSGAEGNHSGPLPQVGTYLDEQPVTTIGGTLDVHIYDIARIESLAGPAGHALRRVERSGHDPHHHQQARAWRDHGPHRRRAQQRRSRRCRRQARRHDQPADRAQHRVPRRCLLPARRRLHRQFFGSRTYYGIRDRGVPAVAAV